MSSNSTSTSAEYEQALTTALELDQYREDRNMSYTKADRDRSDPKQYLCWEHWLYCRCVEAGIRWLPLHAGRWEDIKKAEGIKKAPPRHKRK